MAIIIPNQRLTREQATKLFSNPVSGIACQYDHRSNYDLAHGVRWALKDIRYSKSMLIRALEFWSDQIFKMYLRMTRITNPLEPTKDGAANIMKEVDYIESTIKMVKEFPDSFLYSHRYIQPHGEDMVYRNNKAYENRGNTEAMSLQLKLLNTKYQKFIGNLKFQKQKMDPFTHFGAPYGIEFTVFPNEHPYIKRAIIAEVGQTSKGNVFIIKK